MAHVPGNDNCEADAESRMKNNDKEWSLYSVISCARVKVLLVANLICYLGSYITVFTLIYVHTLIHAHSKMDRLNWRVFFF